MIPNLTGLLVYSGRRLITEASSQMCHNEQYLEGRRKHLQQTTNCPHMNYWSLEAVMHTCTWQADIHIDILEELKAGFGVEPGQTMWFDLKTLNRG